MIDRKLRRDDLIGRKCRSIIPLINERGEVISEETICTIVDVMRQGEEIVIQTEKCPCCGRFCEMSGISRKILNLIEEEV